MTTCARQGCRVARACTAAAFLAAATAGPAFAADMPETILRGGYSEPPPPPYARWDGVSLGAQFGYSNLTADFSDVSTATTLPKVSTNSAQYGGFIGYNAQWDELVLGVEGAYNRFNSLSATGESGTLSSTFKVVDYGTVRARAGYAFGQFLPYLYFGGAVGRVNYQTVDAGTVTSSRDNGYAGGFTTGLGIDVAILPNVFVRAEYEYVLFAPINGVRSSINTARAGVGIRF
jgi:opacity protein-like surface antigen